MRRNEEQRHIHTAVIKARGRVAALALVLIGQVDGALLPDVLQDRLLGALQRVVPCQSKPCSCQHADRARCYLQLKHIALCQRR